MSVTAFTGLLFLRGQELIEDMAIASGVVVAVGDLVKTTGTVVLDTAATTDDLLMIGVAKEAHASTDPASRISVAIRNAGAVYLAPLDAAATVTIGELLQMYTSAPSQKLTPSATDAVAMVVKAGTSVLAAEVVLLLPNQTGSIRLVGDAS
jgi:hypothetical protein